MTGNRRKDIVLATTRQWNPGDEFIRTGVESLLEEASGWQINWLIYDRNPDLRNCRLNNISNSFFDSDVPYVSFIVLAGTSEWCGPLMTELYRYSLKFSIPIVAIGIGTPGFERRLSRLEEHVFHTQTLLIIARDQATADMLSSYGIGSTVMPCPSLMAASTRNYPDRIRSVAVIWQFAETRQPCSVGQRESLVSLCQRLEETGYDVSIVASYLEELEVLHDLNLDYPVYYSYEPKAYLDILQQFDAVVGLRLHGCLLALSLGKPAILVPHDERVAAAAKEVPTLATCALDQVSEQLSSLAAGLPDWQHQHERLLTELRKDYLSRIRDVCLRYSD